MEKIDVRRQIANLSNDDIIDIAVAAAFVPNGTGERIVDVLDLYENEIIRLTEVNARLRNKNRNYRTGLKQLQRAHEATLHRERALSERAQARQELEGDPLEYGYVIPEHVKSVLP